jgi:hypothetical protein
MLPIPAERLPVEKIHAVKQSFKFVIERGRCFKARKDSIQRYRTAVGTSSAIV